MTGRKFGYMNDVDQLIEQTSLNQVLAHYGMPLPDKNSGEHRMNCVFNKDCAESQYGNLTVRLNDPINRIYCHSCQVRGNLLTLIHGLEHHAAPHGGRLRGDEFKSAVAKLRQIAVEEPSAAVSSTPTEKVASSKMEIPSPAADATENVPLRKHEKEAARALADLHKDLITDVSQMSPEAAQYVRKRPWMTPELMKKWGIGWIPGNGRSLFRKSYLVYTHRNERGEIISYSGRDLQFEKKWQKWIRDGKPEGKKPNKHRFVAGFHKGLELYGGFASRLKELHVRESLGKYGIVVVEGMNDVIRMDELGVAAVGLTGNKATGTQIEKLVRFAREAANNRITLLPDCDEEGEAGFKELLWILSEHRAQTTLGISSNVSDGQFRGQQPEDLSASQWQLLSTGLGKGVSE
jgi:hypothetical protein